jgi:hypothetical protein
MTTEGQKQLSDYGITPEEAEYYQLMAKYEKEIDDFKEQFMANPENEYPPTTAQIKVEIQRLEAKEKNQSLYIPGKITTIATDSGQENDMDAEFYRLLAKHKGAINNFAEKFTNQNGEYPSVTDINAELQRLEGLGKVKNTEMAFYRTSTIKRPRRSKAEMQDIRDGIYAVLADLNPMSDRQVFYQMTSRGYVAKNEAQYKGTVCRLLTEMRLDGTVPYEWITDSTRWMIKPTTYDSMQEALQNTAATYRRALWSKSNCYVEIWLEKQALAGIVNQITSVWDVPLMVNHGFGSISYIHNAAMDIQRLHKPAFIYYLADYDPSGVAAMNNTELRLRQFAPNSEIHFERIGVTEEQIKLFNLPTRPTKKTDTRAKAFGSDISVELDALPPQTLRDLVEYYVTKHVDSLEFANLRHIEEMEKHTLEIIASRMPDDKQIKWGN